MALHDGLDTGPMTNHISTRKTILGLPQLERGALAQKIDWRTLAKILPLPSFLSHTPTVAAVGSPPCAQLNGRVQ
jgi:hypothetical protein